LRARLDEVTVTPDEVTEALRAVVDAPVPWQEAGGHDAMDRARTALMHYVMESLELRMHPKPTAVTEAELALHRWMHTARMAWIAQLAGQRPFESVLDAQSETVTVA
jgi:hypothetical protein